MKLTSPRRLAAILVLVVALGACFAARRPVAVDHVVLVVVDTLRADVLGCYGGAAHTPNMDRLAAEGLRFASARSNIPITGPSHSSLFTSRWPLEHGVRNNTQILDQRLPIMAELLREAGFRTAGFVSLGVLKGKFGFDRGFETYVDDFGLNWFRDAVDLNDDVFRWLGARAPERGFLWVHYSDPHEPYAAPDQEYPFIRVLAEGRELASLVADGRRQSLVVPLRHGRAELRFEAGEPPPQAGELVTLVGGALSEAGRLRHGRGLFPWFEDQQRYDYVTALPAHLEVELEDAALGAVELRFGVALKLSPEQARQAYLREVEFVDRALGELLAALETAGWLDSALVVLCSDHGEGLGDHDLMAHIHQLYDSLLHVPLIVWAPGLAPAGVVDTRPVGLVDILPTVLRLADVASPHALRGQDLLLPGSRPPLLAQTFAPEAAADLVGLLAEPHKLIHHPGDGRFELYDVLRDPAELSDLAATRPAVREALAEQLRGIVAAVAEHRAADAQIDAETAERLRALGYLTEPP